MYNAGYNANRSNPTGNKLNFFGYSKGHYFAPKSSFSVRGGASAVTEFKDMVKKLHTAGIEVIMEFYFAKDTTPQLVIDCIRYWVMEYHIDGAKVNLDVANVDMLKSDPILWDTKIIGDRWDIISSCEKYNPVFGEKRHIGVCHDGFMVAARRFIKSDEGQVYEMVSRMKDNNEVGGIINYLGNHNSFTLLDAVSYERKHNEANGESNIDGNDYNYSWNCGVEGTTKKQKVVSLRKKQIKNALTLLFLSQGTPMIFSGDEMGHTRNGNNNPYCQDNELSYIDWNTKKLGNEIFSYVKQMIQYRKTHKILHMEKEMQMTDYKSIGCPDLSLHGVLPWRIDYNHVNRNFAMLYNEKYTGMEGGLIYIACNMYWENQEFNIPMAERISDWKIDIVTEEIDIDKSTLINNRTLNVPPRSIVVLSLNNR
jgi:glycogen operon protein